MSKIQILKTPQELQSYCTQIKSTNNNHTLGLVPTMGALHLGHASLIAKSTKDNAHTIVSIFVNPAQFGANEDLSTYPRTLESDIKKCEELGASAVFIPSASDMYASDDEAGLTPPKSFGFVLEGFARPSHFGGVLQVVMKLFWLVRPDNAYFGQKDAQQLLIIQKMVKDFFIPVCIVPCPIVRDIDGLALSSRNAYLTPKEREIALSIPKAIKSMQDTYQTMLDSNAKSKDCANIDSSKILKAGLAVLKNSQIKLEYLNACNYELRQINHITPNKSIILLAGYVGKTRLLDNLWL